MKTAKLFYNGEQITVDEAGDIARSVVDMGGIDSADMVAIFRRALSCSAGLSGAYYDESLEDESEDAREEFYNLTEIEIIPEW